MYVAITGGAFFFLTHWRQCNTRESYKDLYKAIVEIGRFHLDKNLRLSDLQTAPLFA